MHKFIKRSLAILLITQISQLFPTLANASGVVPPTNNAYNYSYGIQQQNGLNNDISLEKLSKINLKNIVTPPSKSEFTNIPSVDKYAAAQMIKSGEIKSIFSDEKSGVAILVNDMGAQFMLFSTYIPELLDIIISEKIDYKNVNFKNDLPEPKGGSAWPVFIILFLLSLILIYNSRFYLGTKFKRLSFLLRIRNKVRANDAGVNVNSMHSKESLVPLTRFSDVAGCDEAVQDLKELAEFLKNPEKFDKMGAKVPHGAILVGPPGTGKTLLARAVAGEAGCAFFSAVGSDFVEMYVGVGAARVRDLFARARKHEKAIIFIDEIDSIARRRGGGDSGGEREHDQTINALLHEMDGFKKNSIIVIGATNRVETLDEAILRPGRLDRKIHVPLPDRKGREAILNVHAKNKTLNKKADLPLVARRTPGMSGAELEQVLNEAAIEAVRRGRDDIDNSCLSDAIALVAMGRARKSAVVTENDRLITAWHEAGHTVTAMLHPDAAEPVSVSITPRGHAGGITWMSGSDDLYLKRKQAVAQLIVSMGGRAAEEILLDGEFTQGPSSDLARATELAKAMVHKYGMTRHGLMVNERDHGNDKDVIEEILLAALNDARELIEKNIGLVNKVVDKLLVEETIESEDLHDLYKEYKKNERNSIFTNPLSTLSTLKINISPVKSAKKIVKISQDLLTNPLGVVEEINSQREKESKKPALSNKGKKKSTTIKNKKIDR